MESYRIIEYNRHKIIDLIAKDLRDNGINIEKNCYSPEIFQEHRELVQKRPKIVRFAGFRVKIKEDKLL